MNYVNVLTVFYHWLPRLSTLQLERERLSMSKEDQNGNSVKERRRNFLRAVSGGATVSLSAGLVGTASAGERDRDASLSDAGAKSSIANTVRDANDPINRSGGGWSIRNVGFRNRNSSSQAVVTAAVTDANQSAVIEGCYFGDGGGGPAILVPPSHAGKLVIRNSYFEGWGNNAIYGSPPGNPSGHSDPGSGGVVAVEDCYAKGNAVSNYRLGTDGSYIRNCVSLGSQRGYWGFYNSTRVLGCDIAGRIHASDNHWQDPAVVTVENSRFSGTHLHYDGATIDGTSQGQPRDRTPGVPLSPSDAKNGNRS
jgi:hypothetical protein